MKHLVILIHGTFASQAPWTLKDSDFRKKVEGQLGGTVEFASFVWSGKNDHRARVSAAEQMLVLLNNYSIMYPTHKKTIIAHSHGGNVALYALKNANRPNDFDLVTMATPFLNIRPRDHGPILRFHSKVTPFTVGFMSLLAGFVLVGGTGLIFEKLTGYIVPLPDASFITFIPVYCFFCMYIGYRSSCYIKKFALELPSRLDEICQTLSLGEGAKDRRLLAVIDHSDEVGIWFGSLYRIWEIILTFHELTIKLSIKFAKLFLFGFVMLMITSIISAIFSFKVPQYIVDFLGTCFSICILLPIITFTIPPIFYLIRFNTIALGWEPFTYQMFIQTTPGIVPFRYHNASLLLYKISLKRRFKLKHGIHEDDNVLIDICNWIKLYN